MNSEMLTPAYRSAIVQNVVLSLFNIGDFNNKDTDYIKVKVNIY